MSKLTFPEFVAMTPQERDDYETANPSVIRLFGQYRTQARKKRKEIEALKAQKDTRETWSTSFAALEAQYQAMVKEMMQLDQAAGITTT